MSLDLEALDFFCEEHHELLRIFEDRNNRRKKIYETRTREVRGIEELDKES